MPRKKKIVPEVNSTAFEKVLCFTTSHNRPYMLYNCIRSICSQSFKDFKYSVNININTENDKIQYQSLLKEFNDDPRIVLSYTQNSTQHENYLKPIIQVGRDNYNLYIKIDDDDIYQAKYLETMIAFYKKSKKDIISCSLNRSINGQRVKFGKFDSIGTWGPDTESKIKFGMPCTYVFNQSALNILLKISPKNISAVHIFEDPVWRQEWRKAGLTSAIMQDADIAIYHIHGKNSSSSYLLENVENQFEYIENEYFILANLKHKYWNSYCYMNKRNSRVYLIENDDHGAFVIKDDSLKITWDDWGEEVFIKNKLSDNKYYYSLK